MTTNENNSEYDTVAIENFRQYLQIPTVHPNIDYGPVVKFLGNLATDLELPIRVYEYFSDNPVVVISWIGSEPSLPSILLNSHMDTVPVNKEAWKYNPFGGDMDENGNIYARGAQDCKSVGLVYLEAIRRLKKKNFQQRRTVHVLFVPDEEVAGAKGMGAFVKSDDCKALNVGFAIDEGFPDPGNKFWVSYIDRLNRRFVIHCQGQTGHGSLLLENTAGEKVAFILSKIYQLRAEQVKKVKDGSITLSGAISINLTQMIGGLQANVISQKLTLVFDCRLPPLIDVKKFEETLNEWCREAGEKVTFEFLSKHVPTPITTLDDSNEYWVAVKNTFSQLNIPFQTWINPATTDAYHLRNAGIQTIGFIPFRNTPVMKHADNEYLNMKVFLDGISVYTKLLPALTNV